MRLILIRHGETEANVMRVNNGHEHSSLTARGREQAKLTGRILSQEKVHKIYSSDLARARETCAEIVKHVPAVVEFVPELRERRLGVFEGLPYGSFKAFAHENGLDTFTYRPEDGESIKESFDRVNRFFDHCMKAHMGETIVWVSHGTVIKRLILHHLKNPRRGVDYHPSNCAINILEVDEAGKVSVSCLNKVDHLTGLDGAQE